jgi:Flp pilus assembly protein TadG
MGTRWRRFISGRDGSVILEAALMITVLVVLAFGMIDFGRLMYTLNTLTSAAREGARTGAVMTAVNQTTIKAVVRARFNPFTFGGDALTDARIVVVDSSTAVSPFIGDTIRYKFKWLTPVPCLLRLSSCSSDTTGLKAYAAFRYEEAP